MAKPAICIQTDFGIHWGAPSSMRGVIYSLDPEINVSDVTHMLPKFDPWAASYCLFYTMPCWPTGTIFISVVDPGVGTDRKACIAKTSRGQYVVTPDNGALTHVKALHGIDEVREIDEAVNRRPDTQAFQTFHGRDLFAYAAAKLAAGHITYEEVGPAYPVEDIVCFSLGETRIQPGLAQGIIANADYHFGSVGSNIPIGQFEEAGFVHGDLVQVTITHQDKVYYKEKVLYHRSFGYVGIGEPILFNGLSGYMSLGLNERSLPDTYGVAAGNTWEILFQKT